MTIADTSGTPARSPRGRVGRRSPGSGPQPYDFRRPTKLSREHVRTLQIAYEAFARQYATVLTSSLRVVGEVNLTAIEQLTYHEYVERLDNPTIMCVLSVEPLPGVGILDLSVSSAMSAIDHLLGGPGAKEQPQRPLSDIEATLLRGLLDRMLAELQSALDPLVRLRPQLARIEYNPQFAQAASPSDMLIVASFDVHIGADECVATVCLPFNALLPLLEAASGPGTSSERERRAREAAGKAVAERLEAVPVDVTVRFRPVGLTPEEVLALDVGDVVPLRHPTSAPLAVTAADVTFAHAVPGSQGKRLACLIVESPEGENPA